MPCDQPTPRRLLDLYALLLTLLTSAVEGLVARKARII